MTSRIVIPFFAALLLASCKLIATDAPIAFSDAGGAGDFPLGTFDAEVRVGDTIISRPTYSLEDAGLTDARTIAYRGIDENGTEMIRGQMLVSDVPGQDGLWLLSVMKDSAQARKSADTSFASDPEARNYSFVALKSGDEIHVHAITGRWFETQSSVAITTPEGPGNRGIGIVPASTMRIVLTNADLSALIAGPPFVRLTPSGQAQAKSETQRGDALLAHGIPDAKLLYRDDSGAYYGAYMAPRDFHPIRRGSNALDLYVYALRKPLPNGQLWSLSDAPYTDGSAKRQAGKVLDPAEIARMNDHVVPALKAAFPQEASIEKRVVVRTYLDGYHGRSMGGFYMFAQAERAIAVYQFFKLNGSYRPDYEKLGMAAMPAPFNTVAAVKENFTAMAETDVAARKENLALYADFRKDRTERIEQRYDRILQEMNAARRVGIVYKNSQDWSAHSGFDDVRDVFDGNFTFVDHAGNFANGYTTFARMFDAECRQYLQKPRLKYTVTSWKEDEWGIPYDQDTSVYYIDARLAPQYEALSDISGRHLTRSITTSFFQKFKEGDLWGAFGGALQAGLQPVLDFGRMRAFISANGCQSASVRQLLDNYVAAANGRPSMQAAGKVYPGAGGESSAYSLEDSKRTYQQGLGNTIRRSRAGVTPPLNGPVIQPYKVGDYALDNRWQNRAMNKIGLAWQERGEPVLNCYYGPYEYSQKTGNPVYKVERFWYRDKPKELEVFLAARKQPADVHPGLTHSVDACPPTLAQADALVGPKPSPWK